MQVIEEQALNDWLSAHPDWFVKGEELCGRYKFKDFMQAFGFLTQAAIFIEKHDHHPKIENAYNKVQFSMNTHDAGNKITDRDLKLAEAIESIK